MEIQELASIKKSTEMLEYISKEEFEKRIEIIKRSRDDIIWWAENFFRIVNMSTGLEVIKLYPKQKELLNFLIKNDRIVTLASRQTGKCGFRDTIITVRNKNSGKIEKITLEKFFNLIKDQCVIN